MEKIFSYGTLQYETVQLSLFGRKLQGTHDKLPGFILGTVEITDPTVIQLSGESVHKTLIETKNPKDQVEGIVFDITKEELLLSDRYEVDYYRVAVVLTSGTKAWIYTAN